MRTLLLTAMASMLLLNSTFAATATHPPHVTRYIDSHYEIAVRESERSGIPASVILAQGIIESSWGLGELSTNSNNHFGIKCKSFWTGPTYYHKDDDYQNGELVKSCFRVYESVEDSYIDHTNFLVEGERYKKLFNYDRMDYKNWSIGLKACGYATAPDYAEKLIGMIEKYDLTKYDGSSTPIISAPIFHIPKPEPMPQTTIPQEEPTDLTMSPTVLRLMSSNEEPVSAQNIATLEEEEVPPPAVLIEGHVRYNNNEYNVESEEVEAETTHAIQQIVETGFIDETLEEEEMSAIGNETSVAPTVFESKPTSVAIAPNYQMQPLPKTESPTAQTELSVTKAEENHLQVMKGKMRVTRKPRK